MSSFLKLLLRHEKKPTETLRRKKRKKKNVRRPIGLFFIPATFTKTSSSLFSTPNAQRRKKRKRGREGRDLLFDLLFVSLSSSSSSSERERERRKREVSSFFFFFSLFLFCGGGETFDLFTSRRVSKDFEREDDDEWNCLEALDRHRTSISPRSLTSSTTTGGEETARVVMCPRSGRCEASYRPRICA